MKFYQIASLCLASGLLLLASTGCSKESSDFEATMKEAKRNQALAKELDSSLHSEVESILTELQNFQEQELETPGQESRVGGF